MMKPAGRYPVSASQSLCLLVFSALFPIALQGASGADAGLAEGELPIDFGKKLIQPTKFPSVSQLAAKMKSADAEPVLFFCLHGTSDDFYVPKWSPDARQIAFLKADISNRTSKLIAFFDPAQPSPTELLRGIESYEYMFEWTRPLTGGFVFSSTSNDEEFMEIYFGSQGRQPLRLTTSKRIKKQPAIHRTASGTRLVYEAEGELLLQKLAEPPTAKPSSPLHLAFGTQPEWSPDGKRLVYAKEKVKKGDVTLYEITVRELAGQKETPVFTKPGQRVRNPVWSPDGKKIAFYGSAEEDAARPRWNIYVADAADLKTAPKCIAEDVVVEDNFDSIGPAWGAQSDRILYFAKADERQGWYPISWSNVSGKKGKIPYSTDYTTGMDLAVSSNRNVPELAFAAIERLAQGIYVILLNHY